MPKNGRLTEVEFNNIKLLQFKGMSTAQISKVTKRSEDTVRRCYTVEEFPEYLEQNKTERKARLQREAEQQRMDIPEIEEKRPSGEIHVKLGDTECWKIAKRSTAMCAIQSNCKRWYLEDGSVTMEMTYQEFVDLADHYAAYYEGSEEEA